VLPTQQQCYRTVQDREGGNASSAARAHTRTHTHTYTQTRYPGTKAKRVRTKGVECERTEDRDINPTSNSPRSKARQVPGVCTGCPAKTERRLDTADLRSKSSRSSRGRGTSLPGFLARPCPLTNCRAPRRGAANSALIKTGTFKGLAHLHFRLQHLRSRCRRPRY